jgi:hypothetical protein
VTSLLLLALAPATHAAVIKPAAWTASSTASPNEERTFDVANLGDGKQGTAWVEGEDGGGLGSYITVDLGSARTVSSMTVWAGNWYSYEFFHHYNRPKSLVVDFGDGTTEEVELADEFKPQLVTFKKSHSASSIRLKIKSIHAGKGVDTAISEIVFRDGSRDAAAPVAKVVASSVYAADADGHYDPENVVDGIVDSMWCEGARDGDGAGEWIEFVFRVPSEISKLKLRNGSSVSPAMFKQGNRATSATLSFGDGSTESVAIKDMYFDQVVSFPARTTDRVRVTFTGVARGTEFNDLCVSEATFLQ